MKSAFVILLLAGGVVALTIRQSHTQHRLRDAQATLEQQQKQLESLRAAKEQIANQEAELERLRNDSKDVLRLRAQVSQMRRDLAEQKAAAARLAALQTTDTASVMPKPQISIRCKFIAVPQAYGKAGITGILSEPQRKVVLKALEQVEGAEVIGDQNVTTLSGRAAQISSTDAALAARGYTNIGPMLTVLATCTTNSPAINLSLVAEFRELTSPSSPQDGSLPSVEVTALTNSATVWDGQTMVLSKQLPAHGSWTTKSLKLSGVAGPRNLFVLVTPTLIDRAGNRVYSDQDVPQNSIPGQTALTPVFPGSISQR